MKLRKVAFAIKLIVFGEFRFAEFVKGRVEIDTTNGGVGSGTRVDGSWHTENIRNPNAAFIEHALAATERCVIGFVATLLYAFTGIAAHAPIIAGENDQSVF